MTILEYEIYDIVCPINLEDKESLLTNFSLSEWNANMFKNSDNDEMCIYYHKKLHDNDFPNIALASRDGDYLYISNDKIHEEHSLDSEIGQLYKTALQSPQRNAGTFKWK